MKVIHRLKVRSRCPENGDFDVYEMDVETNSVVLCEEIVTAAEGFESLAIHQEALTQQMADRIGSFVRTVGTHCGGKVETTVCCRPKNDETFSVGKHCDR